MIFLIRSFYIVITIVPQLTISNLKPLYLILSHINKYYSCFVWYLKLCQIFCYVEELPENVYDYFISEAG